MKTPFLARSRRCGRQAESGRTLVELLVTLAIAGIVGVSLSSITVLGLRFSRQDQFEDQRVYPVRNAFDMITRDLRLAAEVLTCGTTTVYKIRVSDTAIMYTTYTHDPATRRVTSTAYDNPSCSGTSTTTVLGNQITYLNTTQPAPGKFVVEMKAQSSAPDNTVFTLVQEVTGRVVGQ